MTRCYILKRNKTFFKDLLNIRFKFITRPYFQGNILWPIIPGASSSFFKTVYKENYPVWCLLQGFDFFLV